MRPDCKFNDIVATHPPGPLVPINAGSAVVHPQRVHQQQHPHGAPSPRDDRDDCHSPHRQRDESGALSAAAAFVHDPSLHLPLIVPPPQARRTGAVDEGTLGPVMGPLQAKEQSKASNGGKAKYRISRKK